MNLDKERTIKTRDILIITVPAFPHYFMFKFFPVCFKFLQIYLPVTEFTYIL